MNFIKLVLFSHKTNKAAKPQHRWDLANPMARGHLALVCHGLTGLSSCCKKPCNEEEKAEDAGSGAKSFLLGVGAHGSGREHQYEKNDSCRHLGVYN